MSLGNREGILLALVGPTGCGKTTLCNMLLEEFTPGISYFVTTTSRPPRQDEVAGHSYTFITKEEFQRKIDAGEFFEWENVHGNFYGTPKLALEKGVREGQDLLFQIDIRGALTLKKFYPNNTVIVFITPPTFSDLRKRILLRGPLPEEEIARRMETTKTEYKKLLDLEGKPDGVDYVVLNSDLRASYAEIRAIVLAERCRYLRRDNTLIENLSQGEI